MFKLGELTEANSKLGFLFHVHISINKILNRFIKMYKK